MDLELDEDFYEDSVTHAAAVSRPKLDLDLAASRSDLLQPTDASDPRDSDAAPSLISNTNTSPASDAMELEDDAVLPLDVPLPASQAKIVPIEEQDDEELPSLTQLHPLPLPLVASTVNVAHLDLGRDQWTTAQVKATTFDGKAVMFKRKPRSTAASTVCCYRSIPLLVDLTE